MSRTSRILLLVAAAVVALFALVELPRRRAEDRADSERRRLAAFDPAHVDSVIIARGPERIELARRDGRWNLVAPLRDAAEPAAVEALLVQLAQAEVERVLGRAEDPAPYGLDPPVATIALYAGAEPVFELDIGGYTVGRFHTYARRPDGDVLLAPTAIRRLATAPLDDFRHKRVVDFTLDEVAAFTVIGGGQRMRWTRGDGDRWQTVVGRDTVLGDAVAVVAILRRLRAMRVRGFLEGADAAGALAGDARAVIIEKRRHSPPDTVRFAFGADGSVCAQVSGESRVVAVEGEPDLIFAERVETLRDRRLLHFAPERAARIAWATPDTTGMLVREGGAWALPNPALGPLDRRRTADLVRAMRALRYRRLLDARSGTTGLGDATFSLAVYARGDTILDELRGRILPNDRATAIVTSRSTGVIAEMDASELEALRDRFRRVRPR